MKGNQMKNNTFFHVIVIILVFCQTEMDPMSKHNPNHTQHTTSNSD